MSNSYNLHQATYSSFHFNCFLFTSHIQHTTHHSSFKSFNYPCISTNNNTSHTYSLMRSRNGRQSFPNTRSIPLFIHKNRQFLCLFGHLRTHRIIIETATDIRESILQELAFATLRLRVHLHIAARNARMRLLIHHSQLSRLHRQCHEQRIVQRITSSAQYSVSFRTSTKTFFSLYSFGCVYQNSPTPSTSRGSWTCCV